MDSSKVEKMESPRTESKKIGKVDSIKLDISKIEKMEPPRTDSTKTLPLKIGPTNQPPTKTNFHVCFNVYPTIKRSIDRWNSFTTNNSKQTFESGQKERICQCLNVHKLTINAAVLCIITGVLRIVLNNPAILVPFNIYNGTSDIASEFVEDHSSIMIMNKSLNILESFFLIVISCAMLANYKSRYAHYYLSFVIIMIISSVTSFIRLLHIIFIYLFYPINNIQPINVKKNQIFWIHFIGFLLSSSLHLLMAMLVYKARSLILENLPKRSRAENGVRSRIWKVMSAYQRRREWAKNERKQKSVMTMNSFNL